MGWVGAGHNHSNKFWLSGKNAAVVRTFAWRIHAFAITLRISGVHGCRGCDYAVRLFCA